MWYNHPFSQRKKTTKRRLGADVGGDQEGVTGQNFKKMGEVDSIGVGWGHKLGRLGTFCQLLANGTPKVFKKFFQNISLCSIPTCLMLLS